MKIQNIQNRPLSRNKPYLILEAGVNHEGSLDKAFEMIDAAADAGADMVKFQSYKAHTLASKNSPAYWDQSKEPTTSQYTLFQKHDHFGDEDYAKLAERCTQKEIAFCSTPFDAHFVDFLEPFMPVYKIASADITNRMLLKQIASKKKPVLLSTGASNLDEVEGAVQFLSDHGVEQLALLHCVLEYPTIPEHAQLNTIPFLAEKFPNLTIGYSDHVPPGSHCLPLIQAWLLGADILEKHYTYDKTLQGNDHYHAMDADDVKAFIKSVEQSQAMRGERNFALRPWEEQARKFARRSLVAKRDLKAGHILTEDDLIPKRPGTGISPLEVDTVVGMTAVDDISEDTILEWSHLKRA